MALFYFFSNFLVLLFEQLQMMLPDMNFFKYVKKLIAVD